MSDVTVSPLLGASGGAASFLSIDSGSLAGQRFQLPTAPGALLLGRERMCNVRFDPASDRVVGRTHARIEVRADGVYLVDLHSANGTFRADGKAVRGEVRLAHGERFQLGGEGGPWLSVQLAVPPVAAEHVLPPYAEMPTVIMQLGALQPRPPGPEASRQTVVIQAAVHAPPLPRAPITAPERPQPVAVRLPAPEIDRPHRPEPRGEDLLAQQRRRQFQRQIVVIGVLLLVACGIGLTLGLRDVSGDGDAPFSRSE